MGDSHGMLIMFFIMMGGYLAIYAGYRLYSAVRGYLLRRRNRRDK